MPTSSNLDKPLGQILVEKNIISQKQLESALKEQKNRKETYLGNLLLEMGVSQGKINAMLDQFNKRKPLGQVLIDSKLLTSQQLEEVLAKQKKNLIFMLPNLHKKTPRLRSSFTYADFIDMSF